MKAALASQRRTRHHLPGEHQCPDQFDGEGLGRYADVASEPEFRTLPRRAGERQQRAAAIRCPGRTSRSAAPGSLSANNARRPMAMGALRSRRRPVRPPVRSSVVATVGNISQTLHADRDSSGTGAHHRRASLTRPDGNSDLSPCSLATAVASGLGSRPEWPRAAIELVRSVGHELWPVTRSPCNVRRRRSPASALSTVRNRSRFQIPCEAAVGTACR